MRETLAEYIRLLDALNCGAAIVHRSGRVMYANHRLAEMMRRPQSELVGAEWCRLYANQTACEFLAAILAHFDEPHEGEAHLPLPDGRDLPVMSSGRRLAETGELADLRLVTLVDISHQKELADIIARMSDTLLEQALRLREYTTQLEARVAQRTAELREANLDAIYMLAVACEVRDADTGQHVRRIQRYSEVLARELGLDERQAEQIGYSAILHDVGKMHVPEELLKKPGPLTRQERAIMERHTWMGEEILSVKPFFARARRISRSHHKNYDGSGYPDGLNGSAIPIEARIVHVADVYDALVSPRVYKAAWRPDDAAEEIRRQRQRMFDPDVVDAFRAVYARGELNGQTQANELTCIRGRRASFILTSGLPAGPTGVRERVTRWFAFSGGIAIDAARHAD